MSEIYTDYLPQRSKKKKINYAKKNIPSGIYYVKNIETYRVDNNNVKSYKNDELPYSNNNNCNNLNNNNNNNNKISRGSCDIFEIGCPCLPYSKKKKKLREQGAMVDKPADYNLYPGKYGSLRTHGWYDVKVYYKYGPKWVMHEDGKLYYYEY